MLGQYSKTAQRCISENASYETFLSELTGLELEHRDHNRSITSTEGCKATGLNGTGGLLVYACAETEQSEGS